VGKLVLEVLAGILGLVAVRRPGGLALARVRVDPLKYESFAVLEPSLFNALGRPVPVVQESALQFTLANGSRVISLPGEANTIRGYSGAALVVIDEAAQVSDDFYRTVRPMLAVSRGRMVCLSTPFGKRGWFHEEWHGTNPWERVRITADQCPRIDPGFLA
jgi:hypothetical protein